MPFSRCWMKEPLALPFLEMSMNSSMGRGPDQAVFRHEHVMGSYVWGTWYEEGERGGGGGLTGPDVRVVGEEGAVVHPLRIIAVDRPALAQLGHGEAV